jgi:DnaJ-domain-containing protein 1
MSGDLRRLARLLDQVAKSCQGVAGLLNVVAGPPAPAPDDAYRILGVEPTDPPELMTKVYRAKARVLHPDTQGTGNDAAYKRLQEAWRQIRERRTS